MQEESFIYLMLVYEILRVYLHLQADFGKGCIDSGSLDCLAICNRGLKSPP